MRVVSPITGTHALGTVGRLKAAWVQRFEPYEVSRERIPTVLDAYKQFAIDWQKKLDDMIENPPETITRYYVSPYTSRRDESHDETYERPERFNAHESLKIDKPSFYTQKYERQFNIDVQDIERNIRDIKEATDFLQRRYDCWTLVC